MPQKRPKRDSWLLLMHQIRPKPEALRVKVWRSLQRMGALQVKNAVYALPSGPYARKALGALAEEIGAGGGEAMVCESEFVQGVDSSALREEYNSSIANVLNSISKNLSKIERQAKRPIADVMGIVHSLGRIRSLLDEASERNAFKLKGEEECRIRLLRLESKINGKKEFQKTLPTSYSGRTWVTRSGIQADRMASAWLIQREIDKNAMFLFVSPKAYRPNPAHLRFDMHPAEFTHEGELCTFEVLLKRFSLKSKKLQRLGEIIHDLDIADDRYLHPETTGVSLFLRGLAKRVSSDEERLREASSFFDSLYEGV